MRIKGKKVLSAFVAAMVGFSTFMIPAVSAAQTRYTRVMEYLDRGLMAIPKPYTEDGNSGMYLSWRLLGTEDLATTTFDIYKNGNKIASNYNGTNYVDTTNKNGADTGAVYYVVKSGKAISDTDLPANTIVVNGETREIKMNYGNENSSASEPNSYGYIDIPVEVPASVSDSKAGTYTYSANDISVGDVDNDGQYELIVKWDPSNSKDNSQAGYTGNVLLSCYELDGTMLWKQPINLGCNIRAGAHYTQFMVYDLDADGYAEIVMKTAPGSKDGNGNYVSAAGNTSSIKSTDNSADYRKSSGSSKGSVLGGSPEYLTVFEGATGKALQTIDYEPGYNVTSWGDSYGNRGNRFLAAVGYFGNKDASGNLLPSVVMCRGYYTKAYVVAYDWDGKNLTQRFYNKSTSSGSSSLYGQGNHNLSVSDVDNDGYDEIVYGSAVLDHNGTVLSRTGMGHGDAIHVNDFNNDGTIEVFQVHEEKTGFKSYGGDFWVAWSGSHIYGIPASADVGRGVMGNIDDDYAYNNSYARSIGWTTANYNTYGTSGHTVSTSRPSGVNSLLYWDGDLGREVQDGNSVSKYHASTGKSTGFYFGSNSYADLNTNNTTKSNLGLTADILGDWREEMISGYGNSIRIYISSIKSDYKLTTLMHDGQYRNNVATENVAYNQPPHTSYYIGKAALASSNANYLAPAYSYTKVKTTAPNLATNYPKYKFELTSDKGTDKYIADGTGNAKLKLLSNFKYHSMGGYNATTGDILSLTLNGSGSYPTTVSFDLLYPSKATATAQVFESTDTSYSNALATVKLTADGTNPVELEFNGKGGKTYIVRVTSSSASYFLANSVTVKTEAALIEAVDDGNVEYTFDLTSDKGRNTEIADATGNATFKCLSNFKYHSMGGYNATPGELMSITFDGNDTYKNTTIAFDFLRPSNATGTVAVYNSNNTSKALATATAKADGTNPLTLTFDAKGGNTYIVKITSDSASYFLATDVKVTTSGKLVSAPVATEAPTPTPVPTVAPTPVPTVAPTAVPTVAPIEDNGLTDGAVYTIKNVNSGLYLEVADGADSNGANVQQGAYVGGGYQQWKIVSSGDGYYQLHPQIGDCTSKVLDLDYANAANGTNIHIWNNTYNDGQYFKLQNNGDGTYAILTKATDCGSGLDVENVSTESGANVQQWGYCGSTNQKWVFELASDTQISTPVATETPAATEKPESSTGTSGTAINIVPDVIYVTAGETVSFDTEVDGEYYFILTGGNWWFEPENDFVSVWSNAKNVVTSKTNTFTINQWCGLEDGYEMTLAAYTNDGTASDTVKIIFTK